MNIITVAPGIIQRAQIRIFLEADFTLLGYGIYGILLIFLKIFVQDSEHASFIYTFFHKNIIKWPVKQLQA